MKNTSQIVIVGGGPAAAVTAGTARKYYPDKQVTVIKNNDPSIVPCGIPYMIETLEKPEQNIMPFKPLEDTGVEVLIDEVVDIDRKEKRVITSGNKEYLYEKLVLATGSVPSIPPIKGIGLKNVYSVKKDYEYLKEMIACIRESDSIAVIGGGFIGVEFCDEITKLDNKKVCLIEALPNILANSFDVEFSDIASKKLEEKGVALFKGVSVEEILGDDKVEEICLSSGNKIKADMVVLCIGGIPNTDIAVKAKLNLGLGKGIWVDEYMRTIDEDIFAVGDCAGKRDFFTRKNSPVMLASTATAESRIAGANLYKLKTIRENKGTIAAYSTYISGLVLASAGLTEATADKENFEVVVGRAESLDKHPGTIPGASKLTMKLVFSKQSGILMGGQVVGGNSTGEIINTIGLAIQKNVSMSELESFQMATHPCVTPPPTKYSIVQAAMDAMSKVR